MSRYAQRGHSVKRSIFERLTLKGSFDEGSNGPRLRDTAMLFGGGKIRDHARAGIEIDVDAVGRDVKHAVAVIAIQLDGV